MSGSITAARAYRLGSFVALAIVSLLASAAPVSAQTVTFTASGGNVPITINDNAAASPYPSNIVVSGIAGPIYRITVTLDNFTHTFPDDVGFLLVSPTGVKVRLATDVGAGTDITNLDLTFDDNAAAFLPDNAGLTAGTFKPTQGVVGGASNIHPANFPAPAPAGPYSLRLSDLIGTNANGTWSLYVDDDTGSDIGTIAGWSMTITGGYSFSNFAPITISDGAAGSPYPATINVAGIPGVLTSVTIRLLSITHDNPDDIGVLLVSPSGDLIRLMVDAGGTAIANDLSGVTMTFADAAANVVPDNGTIVSTNYRPTLGASGTAGDGNPHPANFLAPAPAGPYLGTLAGANGDSPNGVWSLYIDEDDTAGNAGTVAGGWTLAFTTNVVTAASTSIAGRVVTLKGQPIGRASISVLNAQTGAVRTAVTNPFGYYTIDDLQTGEIYVVSVQHKRYMFENPSVTISLTDFAEINFDGFLVE